MCPGLWTQIGKAAQNRAKQEWKKEKPKLDDARRLRGICFVDPEDGEFKETIKNARRKLEVPMEAAMSCKKGTKKLSSFQETGAKSCESNKVPKTKKGCRVESHEPTRQRVEPSLPKNHEDHIAGKGYASMSHYNLMHKLIPIPQAMKIPDAKAPVDKEWKNLETIPAWQLEKVKSKKEVILEAQRDKKKVHFAALMDICHQKMRNQIQKFQKYKGRVVLRGDIVKDDSGACAVFY